MKTHAGLLSELRSATCQGARSAGAVVSLGIVLLAAALTLPLALEIVLVAAMVGAAALSYRRRRRPSPDIALGWLDFELGSALAVLVMYAVLRSPGGLTGLLSGLPYVFLIGVAGFTRPRALSAIAAWLVLVHVALAKVALPGGVLELAPQTALLVASAFGARFLAQRAERGGGAPRTSELPTARSAQRAARANGRTSEVPAAPNAQRAARANGRTSEVPAAPSVQRAARVGRISELPPAPIARGSEPSGGEPPTAGALAGEPADARRDALGAALDVCRLSLGAHSVLALALDASHRWLFVRDVSSAESAICPGPFAAAEGVLAAAVKSARLAELLGSAAARQVPYYKLPLPVGHVAAYPIGSAEALEGLLALDRPNAVALNEVERQILAAAAGLARTTLETERRIERLERSKLEQGKLYRAVEQLNGARSETDVIQAGVASARELAAFHFAAVTLVRAGGEHEICAVAGPGAAELSGKTFRDQTGLVGMVVQTRHALPYRGVCESGRQIVFTRALPAPEMRSLLVLPLLVHDEVLGTLVLGSEEPLAFGSTVRPTLEVLTRHVAVSLSHARMMKRLEDLATTDGLTGLLNKRALVDAARQKLRSALRFQKPLSVLVCDLDHFKSINDTHGHDVGDQVIRGFAEVLKRGKRDTDVVGRFGGEEFLVVCEQTDLVGAQQLGERIRSELSSTTFTTPSGSLRVTCSVGIAAYPQAGADWDELFRATDEALYASKRGGRDRVTVWAPRIAKVG